MFLNFKSLSKNYLSKNYFIAPGFFVILIVTTICIFLPGCRTTPPDNISFVTWNVQTFFDGVTDGSEYKDYANSRNWNEDKYIKRLHNLADILTNINADIFVLEEIENNNVIQDISNMMAGNSWNKNKTYTYSCFSKCSGDALGCCVFSKYPINNLKNHCLDIKTESENQPRMRPIMEVSIDFNGIPFTIFVNHWKSKSGGKEKTENWRIWQETVLSRVISEYTKNGSEYFVAAGDFNRDINDFSIEKTNGSEETNVILSDNFITHKNIKVISPWDINNIEKENKEYSNGSYFYDGKWERIDHIFTSQNVLISNFKPVTDFNLTDEYGAPYRYKYYTENGYSDHLPLKCTLSFLY